MRMCVVVAGWVASDFESRTEANPAPKFYEGPIKLAPRRPDAPKEH